MFDLLGHTASVARSCSRMSARGGGGKQATPSTSHALNSPLGHLVALALSSYRERSHPVFTF